MAPTNETASLDALINTTTTLLTQFSPSTTPTTPSDPNINPLPILRDAAKLLKAHTTKLSLLAINKPFTPSAIRKVLSEVTTTCLPAIMSSTQLLTSHPARWSEMLVKEVNLRVTRLFEELPGFLKEVGRGGDEKGSLASTGVVWQGCDGLVELEGLGVGGLAVVYVRRYRDMVKDAVEELEEWRMGEDLETEGRDGLTGSDDEGVAGDEFEDLFHAANSMPRDRPGFEELVKEVEGRLKKVVLLFNAVEKRRLKGFKGEEKEVQRLDRVIKVLEEIPNTVDDLAGAFYELDEDLARETQKQVIEKAVEVAKLLRLNWEQQEDQFSEWSGKWIEVVK